MCRRNQLRGCGLAALGLGLLIGMWIDGGFWAHCLGGSMIFFGIAFWGRR